MKIKLFEEYEEWDDGDFEEHNFPDIPETPKGKMYILQHEENGMFLLNADLARNKLFTNDIRKAKMYSNLNNALKINNFRAHKGKWILIEVDGLITGKKIFI